MIMNMAKSSSNTSKIYLVAILLFLGIVLLGAQADNNVHYHDFVASDDSVCLWGYVCSSCYFNSYFFWLE